MDFDMFLICVLTCNAVFPTEREAKEVNQFAGIYAIKSCA